MRVARNVYLIDHVVLLKTKTANTATSSCHTNRMERDCRRPAQGLDGL
jgi:hypothetical protein